MALSVEVGQLKIKLRSIEQLIEDLLQHKMELFSQLAYLEPVSSQRPSASETAGTPADVPGLTSPFPPSWVSVVKGHKRLSLPLYDPSGVGGD